MSKVAVVLSGCGYLDGSEITEAVATLICLSQAKIDYHCFAPDRPQMHVIDHDRGEVAGESRNILREAARIARGKISPLDQLDAAQFDAIVFPGGYGAAKNLSNFVEAGPQAQLYGDVAAAVQPFVLARKPVVAICAAPLVLGLAAQAAGIHGAQITLGCGGEPLSAALEGWGQQHVRCDVNQACLDEHHRFISAPAYMYDDASPADVFASVQAAISALKKWLT